MNRVLRLFLSLLLAPASIVAGAVTPVTVPDKSSYTLFNPTPANLLREMSTDRPDRTESPYTVDAGHVQLEMDFAGFIADHDGGARTRVWNVAPFNFKIGLLNNVDLQILFDSYIREQVREGGATTTRSGVGDLAFRMKINLWGNDRGKTAFAIMPFVSLPTNSAQLGGNSVQGGVIFPLAVELPGDWGLGLMTEVDFLRNETGGGYHAEFVNTITFSHAIVGKLGGYVEFFSAVGTCGPWVATADAGLTYNLTENIQFDAGCNFGVTRSAEAVNPFIGVSVRF